MSRCCLPFTLNLKPKPSCSPGATVGLVCLSATLYLFMQPSSAFDLSETTTRSCPDCDCEFCTLGGAFFCNSDFTLRQKKMHRCPDNVIICPSFSHLRRWKQRCNIHRERCLRKEFDAQERWNMQDDDSDWGGLRRIAQLKFLFCAGYLRSLFSKYFKTIFHHYRRSMDCEGREK